MKGCGDIEEQLTAYLDDLLGASEKRIVEEHLSSCPHCHRRLRELESLRRILAGLDEIEPPSGLTEKVMDRIRESEEKKSFFQRFFFPLHIKVPVQALATVLVVVLAVYVYRSTLPEMGDLERPSPAPAAVSTEPPAAKKIAVPERPVAAAPSKPAQQEMQIAKKKEAKREERAAQVAVEAPSVPKMDHAPARVGEIAEKPAAAQRSANDIPSFSKSAPPADAGRFVTRGTGAKEEGRAAPQAAPAPPLRAAMQGARSRIALVSGNPRETAVQVMTVMRSLGGTRIEEKAGDNVTTVSGWIDTGVLGELKDRLKELAVMDEAKSSFLSGPRSAPVEITIREMTNSREEKPVDR